MKNTKFSAELSSTNIISKQGIQCFRFWTVNWEEWVFQAKKSLATKALLSLRKESKSFKFI
jgi:hypothetical protein